MLARNRMMTVLVRPPGPWMQAMNAWLHREPIASLVYGIYWSTLLSLGTPIAIFYLQINTLIRFLYWVYQQVIQQPHNVWPQSTLLRNETQRVLEDVRRSLMADSSSSSSSSSSKPKQLALLITGCDSGFGKELALWTAHAGYMVFAGCLQSSSIKQMEELFPTNLVPLQMDVTRDEDVQRVVQIIQTWMKEGIVVLSTGSDCTTQEEDIASSRNQVSQGNHDNNNQRIFHALINNAGIGRVGNMDWISIEDYQSCLDVNFLGMVRCCKACLPLFKRQVIEGVYKDARILNITSMAGLVSDSVGLSTYHASKFAAQAFTRCLRHELAPFAIQVASINPSFHETPMTKMMDAKSREMWEKLPLELRKEYGEEYFQQWRFLMVDVPAMFTWKADVVIDQIMFHLRASSIPSEILIGTDARFIFQIFRILPSWAGDLLHIVQPRGILAMQK